MKAIKIKKEENDRLWGVEGGNYFRAKASDMIEALTELLKYYPEELVIISRDYKLDQNRLRFVLTLKELLAFAHERKQQHSEAVVVMAIEDFNFLNSLYKSRKSKRESNKT